MTVKSKDDKNYTTQLQFKLCETNTIVILVKKMDYLLNTYFFDYLPFHIQNDWKASITDIAMRLFQVLLLALIGSTTGYLIST